MNNETGIVDLRSKNVGTQAINTVSWRSRSDQKLEAQRRG